MEARSSPLVTRGGSDSPLFRIWPRPMSAFDQFNRQLAALAAPEPERDIEIDVLCPK